jgi:hypothetical protein
MRDVDAATTGKYVSISCSEWDGLKRLPEFSVAFVSYGSEADPEKPRHKDLCYLIR